jgi:hypothetical protein
MHRLTNDSQFVLKTRFQKGPNVELSGAKWQAAQGKNEHDAIARPAVWCPLERKVRALSHKRDHGSSAGNKCSVRATRRRAVFECPSIALSVISSSSKIRGECPAVEDQLLFNPSSVRRVNG